MEMVVRCGEEYESYTCAECGEQTVASYTKTVREKMVQRQLCFTCNYWHDLLRAPKPSTIIGGRIYSPGNRREGVMRGMAGRRFDIEYISGPHEGTKITTFDLWAGSDIPERYLCDFPDTARFIGGAEKNQVGDVTCWNPSNPNNEEHQSPAQAGIR